ncbi:hypothetical protein Rhopal_003642-T1 [Rhodotorula paludigena]|uniref:DGQHR domain-containing protein n=1 Tax=Rhodotorula paludigena TaxID=86838 RepID=A0AAV5GM93_9BASI|nr:hypothetical protein Rhopal_003642-T1 [Rhodotorula paludigena]
MSSPGSPKTSQGSVQRRDFLLGSFAVSLAKASHFVDPTDPAVSALISRLKVVPQRRVLPENVKKLAESLLPGSLDSSHYTDADERGRIAAARQSFVRQHVAAEGWVPPLDNDTSTLALPPLEQRRTPSYPQPLLSDAAIADLGLYVADGNHRLAVMSAHAQAGVLPTDAAEPSPTDYALAFELYSEDVFRHPGIFFSISLELNQLHSRTAISQQRSLAATLAMLALARGTDAGAQGAGLKPGAVLPNDFGSFVTTGYRARVLETAHEMHPAISVILDNMSGKALNAALGYGKDGIGPGCVFLLMLLAETASFYRIVDPQGRITTDLAFLRLLSRRLKYELANPFSPAVPTTEGFLEATEDTKNSLARFGRAVSGLTTDALRYDTPHERQLLRSFGDLLTEKTPRPPGEKKWTDNDDVLKQTWVPVMGYFVDLNSLSSVTRSTEVRKSAAASVIKEDVDDDLVILSSSARRRRSQTVKSEKAPGEDDGKTTSAQPGARKLESRRDIPHWWTNIQVFSGEWFNRLGAALAAFAPLLWSPMSDDPIRPPRPDWHDPVLLLLSLKSDARARLEQDPFSPLVGTKLKFDQLPVAPFSENEGEMSSVFDLLRWLWVIRDRLLAEARAAAAALNELDEETVPFLFDNSRLSALPRQSFVFLVPSLFPPDSALATQPIEHRRISVWAYPTHREVAARIARGFVIPAFASWLDDFPADAIIDVDTGFSADTAPRPPSVQGIEKDGEEDELDEGDEDELDEGDPARKGDAEGADDRGDEETRGAEGKGRADQGPDKDGDDGAPDGIGADVDGKDPNKTPDPTARGPKGHELESGADGDAASGAQAGAPRSKAQGPAGTTESKNKRAGAATEEPVPKRLKTAPSNGAVSVDSYIRILRHFATTGRTADTAMAFEITHEKEPDKTLETLKRFVTPTWVTEQKKRGKVKSWVVGVVEDADGAKLRKAAKGLAAAKSPLRIEPVTTTFDLLGGSPAQNGRVFLALAAHADPTFDPLRPPRLEDLDVLRVTSPSAFSQQFLAAIVGSDDDAPSRAASLGGEGARSLVPASNALARAAAASSELAALWGDGIALMGRFEQGTAARR